MCYNTIQNAGRLKNNLLIFDLFCGSGVLCDEFNSIITHDYPYLQRRRLLTDYHHGFSISPFFKILDLKTGLVITRISLISLFLN